MKINIFFLILLSLALSACFRGQRVRNKLNDRWAGAAFDRFVLKYGPPESDYPLSNGDTAYLWNSDAPAASTPAYAVARSYGDYSYAQFPGGGNINLLCEVQIVVGKDGIIKEFNVMRDTMGTRENSRCREVLGER
jgi:hypothetical protein